MKLSIIGWISGSSVNINVEGEPESLVTLLKIMLESNTLEVTNISMEGEPSEIIEFHKILLESRLFSNREVKVSTETNKTTTKVSLTPVNEIERLIDKYGWKILMKKIADNKTWYVVDTGTGISIFSNKTKVIKSGWHRLSKARLNAMIRDIKNGVNIDEAIKRHLYKSITFTSTHRLDILKSFIERVIKGEIVLE